MKNEFLLFLVVKWKMYVYIISPTLPVSEINLLSLLIVMIRDF